LDELVERQQWGEYWRQGLAVLQHELSAQAASLYLIQLNTGITDRPIRVGVLAPYVEYLLDEWEQAFAGQPTPIEGLASGNLLEVSSKSWHSTQFLHIRIVVERHICGAFTFVFDGENFPSPEQQKVLQCLVQTLAGNVLRSQLVNAVRERLDRVSLLYTISQAVTSSLDVETVFHQTTELAAHVLNAQAATLYSIDRENNELVFMIAKGVAAHVLEERRMPLDRGVAGWVATQGKPLIVHQARESPLFNPEVDSQTGFTTRNIVCVPLLMHDRTVGVLQVMNKENAAGFTTDDAEWLAMMGQQIAIALDNAQLFARQQEKVRELATLNAVSQTINSDLDANAVLDVVTQSALELSSADRCELFLLDTRKQALRLFASAGYGNDSGANHQFYPLDYGLAGWSIQHNQRLAVRRAGLDPRHASRPDQPELDRSSVLVLPLSYRGRVAAAIVIYSLAGRGFDAEKQEVLQTFANAVAVALQNAELYQNLRSEQERIIKAQEEVRNHLARELHDNTAQILSLIAINLELSRRLLAESKFDKIQVEIDEMQKLARQANREVRTLLFELRPIILESRGLIPALHAYHRQLETSLAGAIHLDAPPLAFALTPQAASAIFSIIQEAVNNIRKHAHAQNVWIRICADKNKLAFEVEDDGVGFDQATVAETYEESGSFGLRNMRERARMFSGELSVRSPRADGAHGTLVKGSMPLPSLIEPPNALVTE
jgi:signal transduction histidine kinase